MEDTVIVVTEDEAGGSMASDFQEKSADLQLLCRFYFLISNLRQPPHNNMAAPACGTGATQLETRPPRLQLLRAGWRDEEITQQPGGGVKPCGGSRWDRKGRRGA